MEGQVLPGMRTRSGFQLQASQARVWRRNVASKKRNADTKTMKDEGKSSPSPQDRRSPGSKQSNMEEAAPSSPQASRSPRSKRSNVEEAYPPSSEAYATSSIQMPGTPQKDNVTMSYCSVYDQLIIDGLVRRLSSSYCEYDTKDCEECLNGMEDGHMDDGHSYGHSSTDNHDSMHTSSSEYLGVESEESETDGEIAKTKGKMRAKRSERKATAKGATTSKDNAINEGATSKDDAINVESSEKEVDGE